MIYTQTVFALLLVCSVCLAQYAEPVETGPATAEDYNTMHDYLKPKAQVIETLPWSEVTTNDFEHHGEGYLVDHLRNHPMLGDELERLHEWLHKKVEALRPNGKKAFIVVECTDGEFSAWSARAKIESAGWSIVHVPVAIAQRIRTVVALDRLHFSKAGFVNDADLNRYNTQFQNRKFKPLKNAKARFVTQITKYTSATCKHCRDWEREEQPKAEAEGVLVVPLTDNVNSVPWFEVYDSSGQVKRYYGKTSFEAMKRGVQ